MRDLKTTELAPMLGISPRGLDELVRTGVLIPAGNVVGKGKSRRWSFSEAVALRIGFEFRRRGLGWEPILAVVNYVARTDVERLREFPFIVLCGNRVWALRTGSAIPPCPSGEVLGCDIRPGIDAMEKLWALLEKPDQPDHEPAEAEAEPAATR